MKKGKKSLINVDKEKLDSDLANFYKLIEDKSTSNEDDEFKKLTLRIATNINGYEKAECCKFSNFILNSVKKYSNMVVATAQYRDLYIKTLMRLCDRDGVSPLEAYQTLFNLVTCEDKKLRHSVRRFIVSDLHKRNNRKAANKRKLNEDTLKFLEKTINERSDKSANEAAKVLVDMFTKNMWNEPNTVNILATCCLHKSHKVVMTGLLFFLNKSKIIIDNNDSGSDTDTEITRREKMKKIKLAHRVGKKSQARKKHMEKEISNMQKKLKFKKKTKPDTLSLDCNVQAIQMIRDPYMFVEELFKRAKKKSDMTLIALELVARMVGYLELQFPNLFAYLAPKLSPSTMDVTKLLVFAAQASHANISADDIEQVVRAVGSQFVNDGVSGQGITLGLNTLREICVRCPYAMPQDLLELIVEYKSYRDKNVATATRALIRMFRQKNPLLLPKSERGHPMYLDVGDNKQPLQFGDSNALTYIPGAEILDMENEDEEEEEEEDKNDENEDGFETCSEDEEEEDDDESEGEWVDMSHSEEEKDVKIDEKVKVLLDPEERRKRAEKICENRILTDEDLTKIRLYNKMKEDREMTRRKRKIDDAELEANLLEEVKDIEENSDDSEDSENGDGKIWVKESDLLSRTKRIKMNKQERKECVEEGRIDRKKYGYQVRKMNEHASTTNRQKSRNKNFMMVRKKKIKKKNEMSLKQRNNKMKNKIKDLCKRRH